MSASSSFGRDIGPALRSAEVLPALDQEQQDVEVNQGDSSLNIPLWLRFSDIEQLSPGSGDQAEVGWCGHRFRFQAGAPRRHDAYVSQDIVDTMYPSRLCRVMKDQIQARCAITGRRVNKLRFIRDIVLKALKIIQEGEQRISWPVAA